MRVLREGLPQTLRLIFRCILRGILRDLARLIVRWLFCSVKYGILKRWPPEEIQMRASRGELWEVRDPRWTQEVGFIGTQAWQHTQA